MTRRIGLERRRGHHRELRLEAGQIRRRRHDEQVADEQVLPREFLDEPDRQAVFGIGARIQILDEQLLALQVRDDVAAQHVEMRGVDRLVDLAPPDLRFARRLLDDELVVRRSAGMGAGAADQRAFLREHALLAPNGVFVEGRRRQVEMDGFRRVHAVSLQSPAHLCRTHRKMTPNWPAHAGRIETIDGTDGKAAKSISHADLAAACYTSVVTRCKRPDGQPRKHGRTAHR